MAGKKKSKVWYEINLFQPDGSVKAGKVGDPPSGRRKLVGSLKRLLGFHKRDPIVSPLTQHAKNMMSQFGVRWE
jgi:hypothetical protein